MLDVDPVSETDIARSILVHVGMTERRLAHPDIKCPELVDVKARNHDVLQAKPMHGECHG